MLRVCKIKKYLLFIMYKLILDFLLKYQRTQQIILEINFVVLTQLSRLINILFIAFKVASIIVFKCFPWPIWIITTDIPCLKLSNLWICYIGDKKVNDITSANILHIVRSTVKRVRETSKNWLLGRNGTKCPKKNNNVLVFF